MENSFNISRNMENFTIFMQNIDKINQKILSQCILYTTLFS